MLDLKYTDRMLQRAIVHHQLRHEPHTKAKTHHTYYCFIAGNLSVDVGFTLHLSEPGVSALSGKTFLGQDHRHFLPTNAVLQQALVEIEVLLGGDEDERSRRERLHCQRCRNARWNRCDADVLKFLLYTIQGLGGVAGVNLELDARMALPELAQEVI